MTTQNTNEVGKFEAMADSDNTPDRVILRQDGDEVIAFLPDVPANYGNIVCYVHVGQHSEASLEYYNKTKPATSIAVVSLVNELQSIGYNVRLVKRLTRPFGGWAK